MKVEEIQRLHVDQLERLGWLRRRLAAGPAVVDLAAITLFWLLFF